MKNIKKISLTILVGVLVAVVYILFEGAVSRSIELIWIDALDTETNRLTVIPLVVGLGFIYFAANNHLAKITESNKSSLYLKLVVIILLGFLSLFAGASLGPEAILIPASLTIGLIVAGIGDKKDAKLYGKAGIVALFVAFFNSVFAGFLGLYLANKSKEKEKFSIYELALYLVAAVSAYVVLALFSHKGSFVFPDTSFALSWTMIVLTVCLFAAGVLAQKILAVAVHAIAHLKTLLPASWAINALAACTGLAVIFLLGGHLVQFTGNESIVPIIEQAKDIGLWGLVWIAVIKVIAIAWSIQMGYRGGLVFPLVFVASTVIAIVSLYTADFNFIILFIAFLVGALLADSKSKIITGETLGE